MNNSQNSLWNNFKAAFKENKLGAFALNVLIFIALAGVYAPVLASSKPFMIKWNGEFFYPWFRYIFYSGFYTKPIDLFFNVLMFFLPVYLMLCKFVNKSIFKFVMPTVIILHIAASIFVILGNVTDPARDSGLKQKRLEAIQALQSDHLYNNEVHMITKSNFGKTWDMELRYMNIYEKLNMIIKYKSKELQHRSLSKYFPLEETPSLWARDIKNENLVIERIQKSLNSQRPMYLEAENKQEQTLKDNYAMLIELMTIEHALKFAELNKDSDTAALECEYRDIVQQSSDLLSANAEFGSIHRDYETKENRLRFILDKKEWLHKESMQSTMILRPFIRFFHWEDDVGGSEMINKVVGWYELSRVSFGDLLSGVLFGIRVSFIAGVLSVLIAAAIGLPLGLIAGFFGGKVDLIVCRFIEIWETMPMFFMLLLVVSIFRTKSIFIGIAVLGCFGWTGFSRFIRGEVLRIRSLPYILAAKGSGFSLLHIMFYDAFPNSFMPVLSLLPFSVMSAMASEAGWSFLGLGEERSSSLGILMNEGYSVFPSESYLLWSPALLLTIILISIALIGDAVRDALDPKMR